MNFSDAEEYLLSLGNEVSTMKLGLESITKLLEALGKPQDKYLKVQVAGTNGKGSVCAFLDSICNTAGIETGTVTSPHLISITERIRINGRDIVEDEFARHSSMVRETAERLVAGGELESIPTFFEQVTAIALLAFAEAKVELAILETGLGGRLDATTAAEAEIAVITQIDLDHQQYLGETIEEIAAEKAAIILPGTRAVVVGGQDRRVLEIISIRSAECGVPLITETDLHFERLALRGVHQTENARIALMIAKALRTYYDISIERDDILAGLENARHPGRLEYKGRYLFDGAHNVGGAKALAAYLDEFEERPITLVFGAMADKDAQEMLAILQPHVHRFVLTEPTNSRALGIDDLLSVMPDPLNVASARAVGHALTIADTLTPENGIILVAGSLYLIGEVKKLIADGEFQI